MTVFDCTEYSRYAVVRTVCLGEVIEHEVCLERHSDARERPSMSKNKGNVMTVKIHSGSDIKKEIRDHCWPNMSI
jgi:hypothetical protein